MLSTRFHCHRCGSLKAFRSRPRNFVEKFLLPICLCQPIRCADCFRRSYRPIIVQAWERDYSATVTSVAIQTFDILHPSAPGPYTKKDSSGNYTGTARAEEVRLQQ